MNGKPKAVRLDFTQLPRDPWHEGPDWRSSITGGHQEPQRLLCYGTDGQLVLTCEFDDPRIGDSLCRAMSSAFPLVVIWTWVEATWVRIGSWEDRQYKAAPIEEDGLTDRAFRGMVLRAWAKAERYLEKRRSDDKRKAREQRA